MSPISISIELAHLPIGQQDPLGINHAKLPKISIFPYFTWG